MVDNIRYLQKANSIPQKCFDGDFVGRVENQRGRTALSQGILGKLQAWELLVARRGKGKIEWLREIQGWIDSRSPFGMKQSILQGKGHGWRGQLSEATTVDEPDNRMNKAGGGWQLPTFREEGRTANGPRSVRVLVGHGGRIDCNFLSHRPIRVIEGLFESHVFELFDGQITERPA